MEGRLEASCSNPGDISGVWKPIVTTWGTYQKVTIVHKHYRQQECVATYSAETGHDPRALNILYEAVTLIHDLHPYLSQRVIERE